MSDLLFKLHSDQEQGKHVVDDMLRAAVQEHAGNEPVILVPMKDIRPADGSLRNQAVVVSLPQKDDQVDGHQNERNNRRALISQRGRRGPRNSCRGAIHTGRNTFRLPSVLIADIPSEMQVLLQNAAQPVIVLRLVLIDNQPPVAFVRNPERSVLTDFLRLIRIRCKKQCNRMDGIKMVL